MKLVNRVYAVKKEAFAVEAEGLRNRLREELGLGNIRGLRIYNRYDIEGLPEAYLERAAAEILSEPPVDDCFINVEAPWEEDRWILAVEALPGQFDQRADSAVQCLQFMTGGERAKVRCAKVYSFDLTEPFTAEDEALLKRYLINPVENREASLSHPETLARDITPPEAIKTLPEILEAEDEAAFKALYKRLGLAMSEADFREVQSYFKSENRAPSMTEIRVLDTYWSDHCRHTTFHTILSEPEFEPADDSPESKLLCEEIEASYRRYRDLRLEYYGEKDKERPLCLMDLGTLGSKIIASRGLLPDLDKSEEINACSVKIRLEEDGEMRDYLLMFKNETHNHPTEIEPFGGAATCLGGAIRDPLSGRSYVYQAMRVTGAADPTVPIEETMPGKLSQKSIVTGAAKGYSSYGNQIGLATGQVRELYHPDYIAKRMEVGAVIASAPAEQVIRKTPEPGDRIVLLGGRTGRDGIGGATGSSREHDVRSVKRSAAEVQKGNAPEERKLQRLFRRPEAARLIIRCNDFGAGGVSVAIGELADSLDIDLDKVPLKYEGLDGTEIAISESQERMAVVLHPEDVEAFCEMASEENLESTVVAEVTDSGRMRMTWRGETIVDLSRNFLDTAGAPQYAEVKVKAAPPQKQAEEPSEKDIFAGLKKQVSSLNGASQAGLQEIFDSSIGAGTVLMPYGGMTQRTPEDVMAAMIPLRRGVSKTASVMSFGFDPARTKANPYRGSYTAVLDSLAKLWAAGADPERIRLSFQEYFPAVRDAEHWGLPFQALLGALDAQVDFAAPAIGGKDSMSGTFGDYEVPPTLISFAVGTAPASRVRSRCLLRKENASVFLLERGPHESFRWSPEEISAYTAKLKKIMPNDDVLAASSVHPFGLMYTLFTMAVGNQVGLTLNDELPVSAFYEEKPGAILVQAEEENLKEVLKAEGFCEIARFSDKQGFSFGSEYLDLEETAKLYAKPLEKIYPMTPKASYADPDTREAFREKDEGFASHLRVWLPRKSLAKPKVVIPVFPGTNCEYDSALAFEREGARSEIVVVRNQSPEDLEDSIERLAAAVNQAQILFIPGGFSGGDEPEGSAKFITSTFRNPRLQEAVLRLYEERDGLILGICNGFQALIKLGLVTEGTIRAQDADSPTLSFNENGRHIANYVYTKLLHNRSPWLSEMIPGQIHRIPISHGEGRLTASDEVLAKLGAASQIVAQYVDDLGRVSMARPFNPNGSMGAVEALMSKDGRILGKMGHSERWNPCTAKNVPDVSLQNIFAGGVKYFEN